MQCTASKAYRDQVGAKLDKAQSSRAVSIEEGIALAEAHQAMFCEASAKTGLNVRKPFIEIVDRIVQDPTLLEATSHRRSGTVALDSWGGYVPNCSC